MDIDAEKTKLEAERDFVAAWNDHAITKALLQDNEEQQQVLINLICQEDVVDLATLCALITAKGHLRGLRRFKALAEDKLEEINQQIKELPE